MNHYTYMIEGMSKKYIGVRTCKCDPIEDVDYFGSSKYLKEAIKENGKDKFSKQILAIFGTRTHAMEYEIALHNHFDVGTNPEFWNRAKQKSTGFDTTGTQHSEERKQKIGEEHKGKKHSEETRRKISESHKGKHHSEESKRRMSKAKKGKNIGEKNSFYGKAHTEETKQRMSLMKKGTNHYNYGKVLSEDHKRKISESLKDKYKGVVHYNFGKHLSEEHKQKISGSSKGTKRSEGTKQRMSIAQKLRFAK